MNKFLKANFLFSLNEEKISFSFNDSDSCSLSRVIVLSTFYRSSYTYKLHYTYKPHEYICFTISSSIFRQSDCTDIAISTTLVCEPLARNAGSRDNTTPNIGYSANKA
ncbi:hypothetical protein STK_17200 [Sulfurisphaera tokodaii str. 7]|uniref:Uncharacterized protein n=1 Tax=Sulfurisphaera tokodaii (strain DSM 16993 / JCM 10545 / NBRC 100140 / 7) TaxID=273063 RepID=Q96ZW6_SULTO|nr:hypothetical protein STK_17200 [Sulfurisphaera tokodaii str. 7]